MKSAEGLGKASFCANQRGSQWPCGERIGRSCTVSYNLTAIDREALSAGKSLFSSSIVSTPLETQRRGESLRIRSVSNDWSYHELNGLFQAGHVGIGLSDAYSSNQFDVPGRASNHQLHRLCFNFELTLLLLPEGEVCSLQRNLYGSGFVRLQGHALKSLEFLVRPLHVGLEVL